MGVAHLLVVSPESLGFLVTKLSIRLGSLRAHRCCRATWRMFFVTRRKRFGVITADLSKELPCSKPSFSHPFFLLLLSSINTATAMPSKREGNRLLVFKTIIKKNPPKTRGNVHHSHDHQTPHTWHSRCYARARERERETKRRSTRLTKNERSNPIKEKAFVSIKYQRQRAGADERTNPDDLTRLSSLPASRPMLQQ